MYQAAVPYLQEKFDSTSTWMLRIGSSGDHGTQPATPKTQRALFSTVNKAIVANKKTTVRVNEIYIDPLVMVDAVLATQHGG